MINVLGRKVLGGGIASLGLILPSIIGALLVLYATAHGPWMGSDSVEYLVSAENLQAGRGLGLERASGGFARMSHFPPAYPVTIAALSVAGGDALGAARALDAILIVAITLLLGFGFRFAIGSLPIAFLVAMVPITSAVFLDLFTGAMSEPLFLLLMCTGCLFLVSWLATQRHRSLVGAGVALGLAAMTRYAGVALIGAGAVVVLVFTPSSWGRRLRASAGYLLLAVFPLGGWLGWLTLSPSGAQAREVVAPDLAILWDASESVRGSIVDALWQSVPYAQWLPKLHYADRLGLLVIIGALTALIPILWNRGLARSASGEVRAPANAQGLMLVSWIFLGCYTAGLALASLVVWPAPDINMRMMAPATLLMWWLFASGMSYLGRCGKKRRYLATFGVVTAGAYLLTLVPSGARMLADLHENGRGYTSVLWQASPTIPILREMAVDASIVTNESAAVMFLAGRPAYDLPEIIRNEPVTSSRRFGEDASIPAERLFRKQEAILVLFHSLYWQLEPLYGSGTEERISAMTEGLTIEVETADATIYRWPSP